MILSRFAHVCLLTILTGSLLPRAHADSDVLIVGDSIMQAVSRSLERELNRVAGLRATSYTAIGSGLARLDLFDWHKQLASLVEERKPGVVLIMMGANDNQPMRTDTGVVQFGTPEWKAEYGRRVGMAMDIMLQRGVSAVHWIELPDMRDARLQEDVTSMNAIVQAEANKRTAVTYQTSREILSRKPGEYSPYVVQPNGMPLDIRANDGIHLNRSGADHLTKALVPRIWKN